MQTYRSIETCFLAGLSKISSSTNEGFGLLRDCGHVGNVQWEYFGFCLFLPLKLGCLKETFVVGIDGRRDKTLEELRGGKN